MTFCASVKAWIDLTPKATAPAAVAVRPPSRANEPPSAALAALPSP